MLKETIPTGLKGGFIKSSELKRVNVDTTVQEKEIRFPTDARLYDRCRERLVETANDRGIELRQSYSRTGKKELRKLLRAIARFFAPISYWLLDLWRSPILLPV